MARAKAQNYDSKRDAITRIAAGLFAKKGFRGASISDLSTACNVSKSLIYHYYAAKEDILYGVMRAHIDELLSVVSAQDLTNESPAAEFRQLAKALLKCYAGAENAQKVLLNELGNLPKEQQDEIISKQRQIVDRFLSVYLRVKPELVNKPAQTRANIMLFFGMVNWIHTWYNPKGEISRDEIADMATQNILGANT